MKDNLTSHYFHAEAHALSGKLQLPFEQQIKKQAFVKLEGESERLLLEGDQKPLNEKKAQENYLSQHAKNYRLEGIVSYSAAHTQVSGHRSKKDPRAFVTLATSSVENLNVLNVVTADKVVGQISTTHLPNESSPQVTFLGTHFENLRIARHKTEPQLRLDFVGKRPEGDDALYPAQRTGLMEAVENQYKKLKAAFSGLGADYKKSMRVEDENPWLEKQYYGFSGSNHAGIEKSAREAKQAVDAGKAWKWDGITCSLVEHIEIEDITIKKKEGDPIVIPPPARCFGHVIHVPDFGTIFLAELKVNHNSFHLTMIRLELGCIADGSASIVTCNVNGKGGTGGGGGTKTP
jgi:hypothetical protein